MILPPGLSHAFRAAAGELGYAAAAWIFARDVHAEAGDAGVGALRDQLGREYPVLDAVCVSWLAGIRAPVRESAACIAALAGCRRLTIVGLESDALDALLPAMSGLDAAILTYAPLPADWDRVLANFDGALSAIDLDAVLARAGSDSALLCFVYGGDDGLFAPPAWLRLDGPDVRAAFRARIAWNVLPTPFAVYPRWLAEVVPTSFTTVVA
ncbi:MAG: hypothetical protein J0M02_08140 [Planctomycetes bacterium]|nr:hypothetical protein [Planctomycetota bacterium]